VLKKSLIEEKGVTQGLEPHSESSIYDTAEAVSLSKTDSFSTLFSP